MKHETGVGVVTSSILNQTLPLPSKLAHEPGHFAM